VPTEIRNLIFSYALSAFDNHDEPYQPGEHWCRPGYEYAQMLDTRILQTCKRIYHEYRLLPITQSEFIYYLFDGPIHKEGRRQRLGKSPRKGTGTRFGILTEEQQHLVQKVHCFTQQYYLESWLLAVKMALIEGWRFARVLTFTLRRSDWWSWESDVASADRMGICPWLPGRTTREEMEAEPLDPHLDYIQPRISQAGGITWGSLVAQLPRLQVLTMEFETEIKKKSQLDVVVERAKRWKFPRQDAAPLHWCGETSQTKWEGPAYPARTGKPEPPRLAYIIATLRFRPGES
jgi:hypothetical protein